MLLLWYCLGCSYLLCCCVVDLPSADWNSEATLALVSELISDLQLPPLEHGSDTLSIVRKLVAATTVNSKPADNVILHARFVFAQCMKLLAFVFSCTI